MEKWALGAAPKKIDIRDYKGKVSCAAVYPESFELKMPSVRNQGYVASCVAHALATSVEYFHRKETGTIQQMSTNYIYGNRRETDWKQPGMRVRDALKTLCSYGDVRYTIFPGNYEVPKSVEQFETVVNAVFSEGTVNRVKRYFSLNTDSAIKSCLMTYGPVIISLDWYADNTVKDGVVQITGTKSKFDGSHCVVIYGWDSRGWKIQNSWGVSWGISGRAILPFGTKLNEAWGVEDMSNETAGLKIVTPYKSSVGQTFAKVVNNVLNFVLNRS